jgi:parallel beta helix pectate lyase-like protein
VTRLGARLLPVLAALFFVPSASADTSVNCAGLQAALTGSSAGDVIVLTDACPSMPGFTLPSHAITLKAASPGIGFDGTSDGNPILRGTNVGETTIQGLTFKNGNSTATPGGAIRIQGSSSPHIVGNDFEGNQSVSTGGAIDIGTSGSATTTITGNTFGSLATPNSAAGRGGAVSVHNSAGDLTVSGNRFVGNTGSSGGGGMEIQKFVAAGTFTISDNVFQANHLTFGDGGGLIVESQSSNIHITNNQFLENTIGPASPTVVNGHGAGLAVLNLNSSATAVSATQSGNLFDENLLQATIGNEAGGGGEWIAGVRVDSTSDTFISNTSLSPNAEGAGVGVEGLAVPGPPFNVGELHAANLVADGNRLAAGGRGAGVYAGIDDICTTPDCPSVLELNDSTVAGNCVDAGTGSAAPGIAGSGLDTLTLRNSIVYDAQAALPCGTPASVPDVSGFTAPHMSVTSSDLCAAAGGGGPVTGAGNICADPLLTNPHFGGFAETATSPTIDAGSNSLVPSGLTTDAAGDARVTDGNGDGSAVVDMGADESPARPVVIAGKDTKAPLFVIPKQKLKLGRNGRVRVRFRCTEDSRCHGTISLATAKAVVARKKAKRLKLGSARYDVAGNKTGSVSIKLSKKARRVVTRLRKLAVKVTITGTDTAGNRGKSVSRRLTLTAPKPKKRRHR